LVRKSKPKKANPNIEFVSPYPLEDCVWQLQNFPGVGETHPIETQVELAEIDEESWAFRITKSYHSVGCLLLPQYKSSRNQSGQEVSFLKIRAEGKLKSTPSGTTLVIGTVTYNRSLHIRSLFVVFIFMIVVFSGLLNVANYVLTIIAVLVAVFTILLLARRLLGFPDDDQRFANAMKGHIKGVLGN